MFPSYVLDFLLVCWIFRYFAEYFLYTSGAGPCQGTSGATSGVDTELKT